MEISETVHEVLDKPSYKKSTRADNNPVGHIRQMRGLVALSKHYSEMSK